METPQDFSFWEWLIGGIGGLGTLVIGYLHIRVNRIEDVNRGEHNRILDETRSNAQIMWDQIEKNHNQFDSFRQTILLTMVTKEDMREFKHEVIEAIRSK